MKPLLFSQADYHQQMFAPFTHVDSPARLIKAMIRDGPPPPPPPAGSPLSP